LPYCQNAQVVPPTMNSNARSTPPTISKVRLLVVAHA
jgi:hypothetical protein